MCIFEELFFCKDCRHTFKGSVNNRLHPTGNGTLLNQVFKWMKTSPVSENKSWKTENTLSEITNQKSLYSSIL